MITFNQARENSRTTFCRQFTFNPQGAYNSRRDGAIVSGMPVEGNTCTSLPVGTKIKIPEGGSTAIWEINNQGLPSDIYDPSCDGSWIERVDLYDSRQWNGSRSNILESSAIQTFLNNDYPSIMGNAADQFIDVIIPYRKGGGIGGSEQDGANGYSCKFFMPGGYELGFKQGMGGQSNFYPIDGSVLKKYEGAGGSDGRRISYLNGVATEYWLRSPYTDSYGYIRTVTSSGGGYEIVGQYADTYQGLKIFGILKKDSVVSPEPNSDGSYNLIY